MLHIADFDDIKAGKVTDVYFVRTLEILKAKGIDKRVRAEVIAKTLPDGWQWAVLGGLEECAKLLEALDVSVRCMPEGTVFRPFEPVLEIEGMYSHFCIYETAILGFLCQSSGIVTKSARCRRLAPNHTIISFGARRMHPSLAPMIERSAYVGGCDGVSVVLSAELLGESAVGTMPHALILVIGSTVEAVKAFDEVISPKVPRIALIDTFNDEKFEALNVASALGNRLYAVRLDTPASRRGNFRQILEEVRWELDLRGYKHVKLFVSGGIDEEDIRALKDVVSGYGVGTAISNAPVVDFSLDIVEVDGKPLAKRGKWSGAKSVWRCEACFGDVVLPLGQAPPDCPCGGKRFDIIEQLTVDGKLVKPIPNVHEIRRRVLKQMEKLEQLGLP